MISIQNIVKHGQHVWSGVAQFMEITPGAAADYPRWTMGVFPSVAPSALSPGHWTRKHQPGILPSYPGRHVEVAVTLKGSYLLSRNPAFNDSLHVPHFPIIQFVCMIVSAAQSRLSSCSHIPGQHDNGQ